MYSHNERRKTQVKIFGSERGRTEVYRFSVVGKGGTGDPLGQWYRLSCTQSLGILDPSLGLNGRYLKSHSSNYRNSVLKDKTFYLKTSLRPNQYYCIVFLVRPS